MARAHGIAVIPHVVKGAFGIGGQWGKGLMSQRREDGGWSPPAYVKIGGGNLWTANRRASQRRGARFYGRERH